MFHHLARFGVWPRGDSGRRPASFVVNTTVPGISVKGKSAALQAHAIVQRGPEGLRLVNVEATVPVKSIQTGMSVRDEHMRNYIFTTADGKTPDLRFEASGTECVAQIRTKQRVFLPALRLASPPRRGYGRSRFH
jgi:polyisoprenoid-binding protein YceI